MAFFFSLISDLTLRCPSSSMLLPRALSLSPVGPQNISPMSRRLRGARQPCCDTPISVPEHWRGLSDGFPCAMQNLDFFLGEKIKGKCHKSHISFCFSFTACQLPQFTPRGENMLQEKKRTLHSQLFLRSGI